MSWSLHPTGTGGAAAPVNNTLTDNSATDALSAAQGVFLQAELTALQIASTTGNEAHAIAVTSAGQTVFTLPTTPKDANSIQLLVNGEAYTIGTDFALFGATTVHWAGAFPLAPTDTFIAVYY